MVRGRTRAIRNNGIIHPRNTNSSEAGPWTSILLRTERYNDIIPPSYQRSH